MQRVLVIGSPGAGKSTLARALAAKLDLPLVHLDAEHWQPGWVPSDRQTWARKLDRLVGGERWVMDGNYGADLRRRLLRADTVVVLALPTWRCLLRIARRTWIWRGRVRPDMAAGCPERLDPRFVIYTLRFGCTQVPRNEAALADFSGTIVRLSSQRAIDAWLAGIGDDA